MTPRLEASFLNYDTKIFFFEKKKWLKELDQNFWLKEMFFLYGSKKWFFVWLKELIFCMTQRIETFFFEYDAENWNLFLWIWRRELMPFSFFAAKNWNFFLFAANDWAFFFFKNFIDSKNWTFFSDMTQRNEIRKKKRLKELNLFFWNMTYRIEPLLFSLIWFKELNFVSKKKLKKSKSSFSTMTQRIELFVNDS